MLQEKFSANFPRLPTPLHLPTTKRHLRTLPPRPPARLPAGHPLPPFAVQAGEGAKAQQEAAMKAAEAAAADAVATDMTKTLKPFTRSNIKAFAAQAVKQVKDEL